MSDYVLDASALLALIYREAGADRVAPHLASAVMSAVNLSETVAKMVEFGMPESEAWTQARTLAGNVAAFDEAAARATAALRAPTRGLGLSLGDRACLALAQTTGRTALTADRGWSRLRLGIKVEAIR